MRLLKISEFSHLLLLHLLIGGFASTEVSEVTCDKKVLFDDESSTEPYSVRETTSSKPVINTSNDRNSSPIVVEALPRNDSDVFRPSVHLGEIEQPRTRWNPFNNVQHVRFDNNLQLDTQHERFQDILQDAYHSVSKVLDEATRPSRIRFQDDSSVNQTPSIHHPLDVQRVVTESSRPQLEDTTVRQGYVDQTFLQNAGKPETQDASTIFGKMTSDHRLTGHQVGYIDASRSPYVISYYTTGQSQSAHQPVSQDTAFDMIKKPESNGVIVVQQQESIYTKKRKFPYQFYQPGDENPSHYVQYVEEPRYSIYPRMRRVSPWKKIIHLIGTFLPLGLLLATLTPNVVRINSTTTQPTIVLSKLRAADLPVEHKRARLLDDQSTACEDRSVCELILAGGEPRSNILQNILWNLATRTPDNIAERNGLDELFGAVRKKNCMTISC